MGAARDLPPSPLPKSKGERLQKVLARAGVASRRHAEALIAAGRVEVNGRIVTELGTRVDPARDRITVDGRVVRPRDRPVYLALYKPLGYLTTARDPEGRRTVMSLAPDRPGLFPLGRLDADSEGLLLLTTDGAWAQHVSHPRYGCTKEYVVEAAEVPTAHTLERLRRPLLLDTGDRTSGAEVEVVRASGDTAILRVVLHEGRNRQIRRMLDQVGHPVIRLRRVRVGAVRLGTLRPGEWRYLTPAEVAATAGERSTSRRDRRPA